MRSQNVIYIAMFFCLLSFPSFANDSIVIDSFTLVQETCELSNGELTVHISGDTSGLSYSHDNGLTFQDSNVFSGLSSGDYLVLVTDGNCRVRKSAQIGDAPNPILNLEGDCLDGLNRIQIVPEVEGGIPPYTYQWEGPNNDSYSDSELSSVIPGTYHLTLTDALGCYISDSLTFDFCCVLDLDCSLADENVQCASALPILPSVFESNLTRDETIEELALLGIDVIATGCGDLNVIINDSSDNPLDCSQSSLNVTREYIIADNHSSIRCLQEFTVENFVPASLITEARNQSSSCDTDIQVEFQQWLEDLGGMQYDACSDPLTFSMEPAIPTIEEHCGASSTVRFIVEDGCGNIIESTADYSVIDNESPSIDCPDNLVITAVDSTLSQKIEDWKAQASATDNCTIDLLITNDLAANFSDPCSLEDIPVLFETTDDCGLRSECNSTIEIDLAAPALSCPSDLVVECIDIDFEDSVQDWIDAMIANTDSEALEIEMPSDFSNAMCDAVFEVIFSVDNECSVNSNCRSNIIISDEQAPELSCPDDLLINVQEGNNEAQVLNWLSSTSATDCNEYDITPDLILDFSEDLCSGSIPVVFEANDICDNVSTCERTVTIVNNSALSIICPEPISINCADPNLDREVQRFINSIEVSSSNNAYEQNMVYDEESVVTLCDEMITIDISAFVNDICGQSAECFTTILLVPEPRIFIPNVFSPDRDGLNDRFTGYTNGSIEMVKSLQIFDRWGNKVFENYDFLPNEENEGWDGLYRGKVVKNDVFTYYFVFKDIFGSEVEEVGSIQVLKR